MDLTVLGLTLQNVAFKFLAGSGWTLGHFANSSKDLAANVGAAACMILGAIMIVVALVKVATGLLSHGKKQTEWVPILVLFVAGCLFVGASAIIKQTVKGEDGLGKSLQSTLNTMGTSDTIGSEWTVN